ncbi:MAG: hypothetical protein EA406_02210 [Rhodospirillales bacterium]|nr:MAG: hypothetical protein EA406_02210 [Rhodospirillales bacterium]
MADDLLADGEEVVENQEPQDTVDAGPAPSSVQYPDWVPSEFHAAEKRGELLDALGVKTSAEVPTDRPDWLPEKFWKDGEGPQYDKLATSYSELEKKLHEKRPQPPEQYEVKLPEGVELEDPDAPVLSEADVELFKELGLDNDAAQKVTDHFWNNVMPVLAEKNGQIELERLSGAWGFEGTDQSEFRQRLGATKQWAEQNLPQEVVQHLRSSAAGVQALYGMMKNRTTAPNTAGATPPDLKKLQDIINSEEYWAEGNEGLREQVQRDYQRALEGRA